MATVRFDADGVTSLTLTAPALSAEVAPDWRQTVSRSASGALRVFRHGPSRYQVSRTFESLSEVEVAALHTFFDALGGVGQDFVYRYRDPAENTWRTPTARLVEPPKETKVAWNLWDVTLTMEFDQHPDTETDRSVTLGGP